jgi:RNA processing factor Prp31
LRTQKKPEENFATDSFLVVQHFKQKQIERLIEQNREKLQAFIEADDEKGVADCMAVHHRLVEVRKEINEIINRVIL